MFSYEVKNQSLSLRIGPPIAMLGSGESSRLIPPPDFWCPVSESTPKLAPQFVFDCVNRARTENSLPPDLVTRFITAPVERPYSAENPAVWTCVSWMMSQLITVPHVR